MKHFKHIIPLLVIIGISLLTVLSCEKDETRAVLNDNHLAPDFTFPSDDYKLVITEENTGDTLIMRWTPADYGVPIAVSYNLYLDVAGSDFSGPIELGITTSDSLVLPVGFLNNLLLNELGLAGGVETDIEIRIITSNNLDPLESNVNLKITPLKFRPVGLRVIGDYQDWKIATGHILLFYNNNEVYEGFVNMNSAGEIKFNNPTVPELFYGYGGSAKLTTGQEDEVAGIPVDSASFYKIYVDTALLTYELIGIHTYGVIGDATANLWDASTPMTYDEEQDLWTINIDLLVGTIKFRGNDNWAIDLNYGSMNDPSTLSGPLGMDADGINITIPETGNYDITVDFSKTRDFDNYTYDIVLN